MKGTYLGEFQEIVMLSVLVLGENAYGVEIQKEISERSGREISRGALHSALSRLEEKGFLSSRLGGATKVRGGRHKKYFSLTSLGERALSGAEETRRRFYQAIPRLKPDISHE